MSWNPIWNDWDKYKDPEFLFNKFIREPFFPDHPAMDWNDYESINHWASQPVVGPIFEARRNELEYEENQRYQEDKARNMGYDLDDVTYPIRSGIYGRQVGLGDYFEASESVIGMFDRSLLKWM